MKQQCIIMTKDCDHINCENHGVPFNNRIEMLYSLIIPQFRSAE